MRKHMKKFSVITMAAFTAGVMTLAACTEFTPVSTDASATQVESNGGFVVSTGDYYYFINGVETYTSDNTYGDVVKGALMRVKKTDAAAHKNTAETVIPSLMVAADYTSGIYIYGGSNARIYYATPNNVKNTSGEIENGYLDFKSASINGSDVQDYFRVEDNATVYRFVEVEKTVYLVYYTDNELHSYNTATKTDTLLAKDVVGYALNTDDKGDPYVYYTMDVTAWMDSEGATKQNYNQIYRVRADATKAPYEYTFDEDWIKDNDGEVPYENLGEIVLDGIGGTDKDFITQFTHDYSDSITLPGVGYTYQLQSYANDGLYFVRKQVNASDLGSTTGTSGELYYLPVSSVEAADWNSIKGNSVKTSSASGALEVVASAVNTSHASSSALFYIEEKEDVKHHYLYVDGNSIYRADVKNDGTGSNVAYGSGAAGDLEIAFNESGATLVSLDIAEGEGYDYVYYSKSSGGGRSVERVAFNGSETNYTNLDYGNGADAEDNSEYRSVKVMDVQHANSWYNYEILDNLLFFANAETVGSVSYNYVYTVDLKNSDGKLMTASEIEALNDRYELMTGKEGYLTKLTDDGYSTLATAIRYYYYTGKKEQFYQNIQDAVDLGKKNTYLYTEKDQEIFEAFTTGKDVDYVSELNGEGTGQRLQSNFLTLLGTVNEADAEAMDDYWATALAYYEAPETDEGLPWWAWLLIGVGIALVIGGVALFLVLFLLRKNKKQTAEPKKRLAVDTTDDADVDVYAPHNTEEPAEEPAEESTEEPAEVPEEPAETIAEEPAEASEEPAEAPAETPAEPAAEEPAGESAPAAEEPAPESVDKKDE